MKLGIVGYGNGGRFFHTPFVEAADGVELTGVVTRSQRRRAEVAEDVPGVPVFDSLTELLGSGVDAVTITTPPETREELVLEALAAGVHVVADKPFAPSAEAGRRLARAADDAGLLLSVFHNRRFDSDLQTLAGVVASGRLGDLWRVHSRFDLDDAATLEAGPTGGLLRDIGSHAVDQVLWLMGPVLDVWAALDWVDLPEGRTDAGFTIALRHAAGTTSYLSSTKTNHVAERSFRAYGSLGSYESHSTDAQATASLAGERPAGRRGSWGIEPEPGLLRTAVGHEAVPPAQGDWTTFYEQFAAAVATGSPAPSPAWEGVATLEVLDAARRSAEDGSSVAIAPRG